MSAEARPEFIAPGEQPIAYNHPFAETERLFIFRRPLESINPSTSRVHSTVDNIQRFLEDKGSHLHLPQEVIELDTTPDIEGMEQEYFRHGIGRFDGVLNVGGDGISSNGNAAAHRSGFEGPLMHVGRGNACDLAHMLFSRRGIRNPVGAMLNSRLTKLYLLEVKTDMPDRDGNTTVYTSGYFSSGKFIPLVTQNVSSDEARAMAENMGEIEKLKAETNIMLETRKTIEKEEVNTVIIEDDAGVRKVSDIVLMNGQRMAKKVHFGGVHLLDPGYGRLELARPTKRSILFGLGKAAVGLFRHFKPEEAYEFRAYTKDESPVRFQRDGELGEFPSGTLYTVSLHPRPLNVVTSR
ncbi:MAG TPA: hypothetical protein VLG13_03560 [Patescibacteria group bacterium]|nr:hypothetical protein [Patescibacteria group bacterium]